MPDALKDVLEEQKAYYQARAAEYDEWFYRQGRYDHGPEHTARWEVEATQIRQALHAFDLRGHVLDVAAGTGIWTAELLKRADHVTALDSSEAMLAFNRRKLNSDRVTYTVVDLFYWQPVVRYDAVFMGFWLSHVPPHQLYDFIVTIGEALKPGGKLFFVDSRPEPSAASRDMSEALVQRAQFGPTLSSANTTLPRRLNDGREFEIVKVFYETDTLTRQFGTVGIDLAIHQTDSFFLYGLGRKS